MSIHIVKMLGASCLRGARLLRSGAPRATQWRGYNFASTRFKDCFGDLPIADGAKLRADTIAYLDSFDPQARACAPAPRAPAPSHGQTHSAKHARNAHARIAHARRAPHTYGTHARTHARHARSTQPVHFRCPHRAGTTTR